MVSPNERCADGPLPAKTQALQPAHNQQLPEVLGKATQEGEEGEPEDGELQHAHTAYPIGKNARHPTAKRREQQRRRAEQPCLPLRDVPLEQQGGQHQAVDHDVHAVEQPSAKGGDKGMALGG